MQRILMVGVCLLLGAAARAQAATIPTTVGIYGTTLRISAGQHEATNDGANIQCYSYYEPDGVTVDYVTCFDWHGRVGDVLGYAAGPNCTEELPGTPNMLIRCDLEDHPITAFDIRFRDNPTPNSVAWQGPLPTVTKFTMKGSHGEDQVNNAQGGTILTVMPNLLNATISKKAPGTWHLY